MALYFQWKNKHPEYKALYYICGAEKMLSLEVLDEVIAQWPEAEFRHASASNNPYILAYMEDCVLMESAKLKVVVIKGVDQLPDDKKQWLHDRALDIVNGVLTRTILICWTSEENPDTIQEFYRPFIKYGRFVECKIMSVDSMVKYAVDDYGLYEDAAHLLIELVSYNFRKFNNELEKLACTKESPNQAIDLNTVKRLVLFSADDLFLNKMLVRDKDQALKVCTSVPEFAISSVLTQLTKKLAFLYLLFQADSPGTNAHKLAAILGVQPWQLLEYFNIKKYWTVPLILERLKLLTVIESNYYSYSSNILPLLASWW